MRSQKRRRIERNYELAVRYHKQKLSGLFFKQWLEWVQYRKDRQASTSRISNLNFYSRFLFIHLRFYLLVAYAKLVRAAQVSLSRLVMQQWHLASRETRQTREYFEVIRVTFVFLYLPRSFVFRSCSLRSYIERLSQYFYKTR